MTLQNPRSELLPKIPRPEKKSFTEAWITALVIAGCVYWILLPIWPHLDTHILGDKQTLPKTMLFTVSQFKWNQHD